MHEVHHYPLLLRCINLRWVAGVWAGFGAAVSCAESLESVTRSSTKQEQSAKRVRISAMKPAVIIDLQGSWFVANPWQFVQNARTNHTHEVKMSPSSIDNELQEVADMFDSIVDHRVIVEAATLDDLDRKPSDEVDPADVSVSVADTEHVDNTNPYLMRYADIYAHSQEFFDPDEAIKAGSTKFIKISRSTDQGDFKKGEVVIYHDKETNTSHEATIVDVHYDESNQPHYDLMFKSNNNENSDAKEDDVRLSVKEGIKQVEAVSGTGTLNETNAIKCVNFDINPTPLFVAMYNGDWGAAQKRLDSHPEEASAWVARYNTNRDDSKVFRWRLLPLHLCVALSGSDDDDYDYDIHDEAAPPDVPDDEKDQEPEQKENEQLTPPRTLLVALLKAYPQGTQCTDDQNLIPLHSAIRGNASLNVVEELLQVDPTSVHYQDSRGRNAHVLAKKVFRKRSSDSNARQIKYERLKALLLKAGNHPDAKLKEEQLQYETRMKELEEQNLSLRRDNALLRTRCERNEDLLEKLVQKLQEYQQKLDDNSSAGVETHDDEVDVEVLKEFSRMESIPPPPPSSKPPPMDDEIAENWKVAFDAKKCKEYYFNKKTRVVTWVKPKCLEETEEEPVHSEDNGGDKEEAVDEAKKPENKVIGGRGAYAKRIERHIQTAMNYEKSEDVPATPTSAKTGATEISTPETWEGRNLSFELESFDEADVANKPFMADLSDTSGEIVQDISSSTIFRLSSHTDKDSVPFDMANSTVSFTNAGAFTYSDMVKVGNAEKEASENAQDKPKTKLKVTFKDVPSVPKKKKPVNPAVSAEIERLRNKFSGES